MLLISISTYGVRISCSGYELDYFMRLVLVEFDDLKEVGIDVAWTIGSLLLVIEETSIDRLRVVVGVHVCHGDFFTILIELFLGFFRFDIW